MLTPRRVVLVALPSLLAACPLDSQHCIGACDDLTASQGPPGTDSTSTSGGPGGPATISDPLTTGNATTTGNSDTSDNGSTSGVGATSTTTGDGDTSGGDDIPFDPTAGELGSCVLADTLVPAATCDDGVLQPGELCFGERQLTGIASAIRSSAVFPLDGSPRKGIFVTRDFGSYDNWTMAPNGILQGSGLVIEFPDFSYPEGYGDFDANGMFDFVARHVGEPDRVMLELDLFKPWDDVDDVLVADEIPTADVTDWDGDGRLDIVATISSEPVPGNLVLLLGDGAGQFTETEGPTLPRVDPGYDLGALDADGLANDFVWTTGLGLRVEGDDAVEFTVEVAPGLERRAVAIADLDADGLGDIVALADNTDAGTSELLVALQAGDFAVHRYPVRCGALIFAVGDLDGDGAPDLAAADQHGAVTIRPNDGAGGFFDVITADLAVPLTADDRLHVVDLDDDGVGDLGAASRTLDSVAAVLNEI